MEETTMTLEPGEKAFRITFNMFDGNRRSTYFGIVFAKSAEEVRNSISPSYRDKVTCIDELGDPKGRNVFLAGGMHF